MANGLRKLIRNARKLCLPSPLIRRFNRFGPRLELEGLEERIAGEDKDGKPVMLIRKVRINQA